MEKYKKLRKIGQGSFGRVYVVEDENTGRKHVLKEVDLCDIGESGRTDEEAKQDALAEVYVTYFLVLC